MLICFALVACDKCKDGHTFENGVCTACGEEDPDYVEIVKFDLYGSAMTLGNTLEINLIIDTSKFTGTDNYAVVTKQYADERGLVSKTVAQSEWSTLGGTLKYVPYAVSAKEMNDELTITIYNADGVQISNTYVDSVAGYCVRMLVKEEQKAAPSAKKMTLFVDMVNYGAAAQAEWSYNAENLANAGLTEAQKAYASEVGELENNQVKGTGYVGTSFTLQENILMNILFDQDIYAQTAYAKVSFVDHYGNDESFTVAAADFGTLSSWRYVQITTMAVADGRQPITVELYNAESEVISTTVDSVESYAQRKPKDLHDAMMAFCIGAYNYFHT